MHLTGLKPATCHLEGGYSNSTELQAQKMVPPLRVGLRSKPYQGSALPLSYRGMVLLLGIEPSPIGCKPIALPLSYRSMAGRTRFELASSVLETDMLPITPTTRAL